MDARNQRYFGDNLKILREYVADASVDLIYFDPPFNSSATSDGAFVAPSVAPTFRSAQSDAHLKVGATPTGDNPPRWNLGEPDTPPRRGKRVCRTVAERRDGCETG
jgi:hypothetical protein